MAKKKTSIIIVIILIVLAIFFLQKKESGTTVQLDYPDVVAPNENVDITISYSNPPTDNWGIRVDETIPSGWTHVSGGSVENGIITFYFVKGMIEDPQTYTLQAPSTEGDYQLSGEYIVNIDSPITLSDTIKVCTASCTRPSDLCVESSTVSDGCGRDCAGSWTVTQNTAADVNCDNNLSNDELWDYILLWLDGNVSNDNMWNAILGWL